MDLLNIFLTNEPSMFIDCYYYFKMRKEFLKYKILFITFLLCFCQTALGSNEILALRKYYGHLSQAFFVLIGDDLKMREALSYQLRNWNGITINDDIQVARYQLKNSHQRQHFIQKSFTNNEDLSLAEICQGYYPQRPRLMIITNVKKQLQFVRSNNWTSQQCAPQAIFFIERSEKSQETDELIKLLKGSGYIFNPNMQEISIYIRGSDVMTVNPHIIANEFLKKPSKIFSKNEHLAQLYSSIFPNLTLVKQQVLYPTQIYEYRMSNSLLSVPDAISASMYFGQPLRPIVVFNFRAEKDSIYVGRANFTIQTLEISEFVFKRIEIVEKNEKSNHIYVLMNEDSTHMRITWEDGTKIEQTKSPNYQRVQYLRGCTVLEELVKVVVRGRPGSRQPIDAHFEGEDPRRQVGNGHLQYHESSKQDGNVTPQPTQQKAQQQTTQVNSMIDFKIPEQPIASSETKEQQSQDHKESTPLISDESSETTAIDEVTISSQKDSLNEKISDNQPSPFIQQQSDKIQSKTDQSILRFDKLQDREIFYITTIVGLLIILTILMIKMQKKNQNMHEVKSQQLPTTEDDFGYLSDRTPKMTSQQA